MLVCTSEHASLVLHVHYEYQKKIVYISPSKICVTESRAPFGHTFDVACGYRVKNINKLKTTPSKIASMH